jgi:hypothetical protein
MRLVISFHHPAPAVVLFLRAALAMYKATRRNAVNISPGLAKKLKDPVSWLIWMLPPKML